MNRREFVFATTGLVAAGAFSQALHAQALHAQVLQAQALPADAATEIRVGYQKGGILPLVKQQGRLEERFRPRGIAVKWVEFSFGPPLLEAMNVGSIDFGTTGNAPPIFAQAAKANLLYVAALPSEGSSEAILVREDSPIRTLADLKGKRVGFAKASSAHDTTLAALEKAGLSYADITPVYLPPADAAAAFARGAIDAWTIWDPYYAIAERGKVRVLATAKDVHRPYSFFLANREFTRKHPDLVAALDDEFAKASVWAETHRSEVSAFLSEATGVDPESERRSVGRTVFLVTPVTDEVIAEQQQVADRFYKLGLIPKPVEVRDIVWKWTPGA